MGRSASAPIVHSSLAGACEQERRLLERVRAGDTSAYGELWSRHRNRAYTIAMRTTRSIEADDLVAEAFTRIFDLLRRGKGPKRNFGGYLASTIKNIAVNAARRAREIPYDDIEGSGLDAGGSSADPAVSPRLENSGVWDAMRELPERWQSVLWHSEVEGMSAAELAATFGVSPSVVAQLAYRARRGLLRELARRDHVGIDPDLIPVGFAA
ncbi:hypothetical protein ATY41_04680 [Leifsonia xyli subsp. xyli]|uniref:RNA polymerase subunit sigma-70 n=1 Tax=Leifsonia xyli subsp. xyli TaxID=59736 RepID=A0A1E2SI84_LEIXY|nr:hypothetical protein ATY41_04680 [Leifsonia xyli subsp. xyli]